LAEFRSYLEYKSKLGSKVSTVVGKAVKSPMFLLKPSGKLGHSSWQVFSIVDSGSQHGGWSSRADGMSPYGYRNGLPDWLTKRVGAVDLRAEGLSPVGIGENLHYALFLGDSHSKLGYAIFNPDDIELSALELDSLDIVGSGIAIELATEEPMDSFSRTMRSMGMGRNPLGLEFTSTWAFAQVGFDVDRTVSLFGGAGSPYQITDEIRSYLAEFSRIIDSIFHDVLPEGPQISLVINDRLDWLSSGIIKWVAHIGSKTTSLSELSWVQQRWLKIAFLTTMYRCRRRVFFIDEPERGLQRKVEVNAERAMRYLAGSRGRSLTVCATHSPYFMRSSEVIALSGTASRELAVLDGNLFAEVERLGLTVNEAFEMYSLILFVEGEQDKAILEGLIGRDRLAKLRILIIDCRGLYSWSGFFDSEIAQRSIGCKVGWLIDGVASEDLQTTWESWVVKNNELSAKGREYFVRPDIYRALERWFPKDNPTKNDRYKSLVSTLEKAVTSKQVSRIRFFSSGHEDVLMWCNVSKDFGIERSWPEIWTDAVHAAHSDLPRGRAFKKIIETESPVKDCMNPEVLLEISQRIYLEGRIPKRVRKLIAAIVEFAAN